MMHKPTSKKLPKKYASEPQENVVESRKPLMNMGEDQQARKGRLPSHVKGRVTNVEKKLDKVTGNLKNQDLQALLIGEIKEIKNELKEIKKHIGINGPQPQRYPEPSVHY